VYEGIPHLAAPVVTDPREAAKALRWAVKEMERRYELFAQMGTRNITGYNELMPDEALPYLVVVIDELADLMLVAAADVEDAIARLAQMARAAGIYLVIATQRPSVDVITGLIKANVPSRLSFAVSSQVDSRTILDMAGAERLLGKGDMLFHPVGAAKPIRAQGALVTEDEVNRVVHFWTSQLDGEPEYLAEAFSDGSSDDPLEAGADDELFTDAVQLVLESGQASISMIQRRFRVGYSRAARLIDLMERRGIVGPAQGSKPREVNVGRAREFVNNSQPAS
ncbi:MAG TPA: FtsK/SpoIIIE domain-containing protein, partial [Limnochorda sp.]